MEKEKKEREKEAKKGAEQAKQTGKAHAQREEWEKTLAELRTQVTGLEDQCSKLEHDNQTLLRKLKEQENTLSQRDNKHNDDDDGSDVLKMEEIEMREENMELRQQLLDLRREMDEMYDNFRENEADEFREIQRELDISSKNCRVLQFKLRKAERKADMVDCDRHHYEDKLRKLQMQIENGDCRSHVEALEEELREAKEVSVRLHDELDMMEDRRNKALEDNRHLTEVLEQTDKKQFRMEMEIDKLRDQIADLKQQLRERSPACKEGTPDRRDVLGRQGSQEYDCAQLMRDLCDSVERETDLKEQLKFLDEESRMLRKKLAEMEDENEALRVQLKKLSLKASKWKEEIEGRGQFRRPEELRQQRERLDSNDDDTSVVTLKLQMALLEQELMTSQKGEAEVEREAEALKADVASLHQKLREQEHEVTSLREQHAPTSPDEYYEEKVRELTLVADELRWRIIEKDRELERLSATASVAHARHHGHHGHVGGSRGESRTGQLKKSKSLDSDPVVDDLRKQLEAAHYEMGILRTQVSLAREQRESNENETLTLRQQLQQQQQQHQHQQQQPQQATVPLVHADDAAVKNIELRDSLKKKEEEARALKEQVRMLTDKLHALSRSSSSGSSSVSTPVEITAPISITSAAATSSSPASASQPVSIPGIPATEVDSVRELQKQLKASEDEKRSLLAKMAELEGDNSRPKALAGGDGPCPDGGEKDKTDKRETMETTKGDIVTKSGGGMETTKGDIVTKSGGGMERKVLTIEGNESREALMDKILDMEEEMHALLQAVKKRQEEIDTKSREILTLREELQDAQDVGRRTELQLLQELDMLHDKNSVLSNLLDIIHERADNAEKELERYMQDNSAPSTRSASAVSQVSALSDASTGSDDVFLTPPIGGIGDKGQIIHRDWEAKLKNRIESLERLLAEERQRVSMAEKKLHLSAEQGLAPSLSDDVKLRLREKELLQEELTENQRHLRVATDQIQGMRERLHAMEDAHHRLKVDYGKLCAMLDSGDSDLTDQDSDKTPENSVEPEGSLVALRAARLDTAATPSLTTDTHSTTKTDSTHNKTNTGGVAASSSNDVTTLQHDVARYKLKAEQLEYKVEEISDIWRSKSAATDGEKRRMEEQLKDKTHEISHINETLAKLKQELKTQSEELAQAEQKASQLSEEVTRRQAAEHELHELLTHATEREHSVKQLREAVSARDERLKEKDDIIHYLNTVLEQRQTEIQDMQTRVTDIASRMAQKPVTSSQDMSPTKETGGETDVEKENARLREKTRSLRAEMEQRDRTQKELELSRRILEEESLGREKERAALQAALNVAEEKIRLYETLSTTPSNKAMENIKKESLQYFKEKEAMQAQVTSLQHELTTCQRSALDTTTRLKQEVSSKLQQLKEETDANKKLMPELERLRMQAERAYRLQQEERLLRAEHQAMKVRYETRVEKMSQEYSKIMMTMETLQKEKLADKEMVTQVQKAMTLIKEAHAQDQRRWEEEKARLDRQIKELSETKEVVNLMQQKTSELREELVHQERCRADVVNKYSTERTAWNIDKSTLESRINQLEEKLKKVQKSPGSSVALETAWAKERAEQQRLLTEAHALALDLQKQLTSRNQQTQESQRRLAEKVDTERKAWDKERKEKEKQVAELESRIKWQGSLQHGVLEVQQTAERQVQQARGEKAELSKLLLHMRQQQSRDAKALDDVMAGLVRLRELGGKLKSQEGKPTKVDQPDLDRDILQYIKQAMLQITTAADDLSKHKKASDNGQIRRSLSSSELEQLREELKELRQESGDVFPALGVTQKSPSFDAQRGDVTRPTIHQPFRTSSQTPSYTSGTHSAQGSRATSPDGHQLADISLSRRFLESSPSAVPGSSVAAEKLQPTLRKESSPKPQSSGSSVDPSSAGDKQRLFSAGRSASSSAAMTTPSATSTTITVTTTTTTSSSSDVSRPSRPRSLTKSLSVDSPQLSWINNPTTATTISTYPRSHSASTTPTKLGPASIAPGETEGGSPSLRTVRRRIGGLSPRTARKKFFEEQPAEKAGFLSWPERGRKAGGGGGGAARSLHVHGVDPREVRRGAEEDHEWLLSRVVEVPAHSSRAMKNSISLDEKMHHRVASEVSHAPRLFTARQGAEPALYPSVPTTTTAASSSPQPASKGGQASAKDRRKLFKKSASLDSNVSVSIARAGMTTLLPPAAPSTFSPSDFLATLKGKLAPAFGRKGKEQDRPPSPLFIPTTIPDIPLRPSATISTTTTTTTIPFSAAATTSVQSHHSGVASTSTTDSQAEDSRGRGLGRRQDDPPESRDDVRETRWRSQSVDRATRPLMVHTDVIVPSQVWQFSETAV
ncbi:uncharacterized protein [Littorina saxatilis]|uniref:uncharacterized protein n=1 Tax=Littorina saxatilis TaxID=31220 RepID=UPI0038B4F7F2